MSNIQYLCTQGRIDEDEDCFCHFLEYLENAYFLKFLLTDCIIIINSKYYNISKKINENIDHY